MKSHKLRPFLLYFQREQREVQPATKLCSRWKYGDAYLSDGMKGRFIKSIKQILSRSSFIRTRIHNKRYNASALVAWYLKRPETKEADEIIGYDCQKAVISETGIFDDDSTAKDTLAQTVLSKAAEMQVLLKFVFNLNL